MKNKKSINVFISLNIFFAVTLGTLLGLGIAESFNTANIEQFLDLSQALPTKILDINSELITEFTSDEKREVISIYELPKHMVDALITREDRIFYEHHGFNTLAIIRAMIGQVTHLSLGGGSTLTQQIAGTLYCNRKEMSLKRKLRELWWAIQMERRYSKKEILELYLNQIPFGGGTGGVMQQVLIISDTVRVKLHLQNQLFL